MTVFSEDLCNAPLHPQAVQGLRLFNAGHYFEAHEALEDAWNAESGKVRDLYRGILQIAVAYLHIIRGNYNGAVKVHERSQKWMRDWPEVCRGIQVGQLRRDAQAMIDVAKEGEAAARARDAEKAFEIGGRLYDSCNGCHKSYVPTPKPAP